MASSARRAVDSVCANPNALRALQDSSAHEHNADLAVIAPHATTAPAQQQRELVGDLLVIRDGEPRAAVGDVPYDAAQRRRGAITLDLSEIMDFASPAVSQLAQRIPRKQPHPVLLPWLQRAAAWRQTRKIFLAPSVKPVSIAAIGVGQHLLP